jgi:hypothetical protein
MPLLGVFSLVLWLVNLALLGLGFLLFRPKRQEPQKSPTAEFKISAVKIGATIPVVFGIAKVGGLIIEWGDWTVVAHKQVYKQGK